MRLNILVLCLATLTVKLEAQGCGVPYRGTSDQPFSWLVAVTRGDRHHHHPNNAIQCGGVLLSNYYVLTAASCITGPGSIQVNFGAEEASKRTAVSGNAIVHPHYFSERAYQGQFDLALIRLNQSITLSDKVLPICLPGDYDTVEVGESLRADLWKDPADERRDDDVSSGDDGSGDDGSGDDGSGDVETSRDETFDEDELIPWVNTLFSQLEYLQKNTFVVASSRQCTERLTAASRLKKMRCTESNIVECVHAVNNKEGHVDQFKIPMRARPDNMLCVTSRGRKNAKTPYPNPPAAAGVPIMKKKPSGVWDVVGMASLIDCSSINGKQPHQVTMMAASISRNLQWIKSVISSPLGTREF